MQIPLRASGPDRRDSLKHDGTQRSRAFARWGSNRVCDESNNSYYDSDWLLQTDGPAAGLSPAARGAITGILFGASLWGAILVLAGFIKV